jgi:glycine cleavage system H protein
MQLPDDLRYTSSHEWIRLDGDIATIGITDHAQSELGDVVYLELPEAGRHCRAGESVAVIESVKAASDIYAPLAGEIVEANEAAAANAGVVNSDPYGAGWLFKIKVANLRTADGLLGADAYRAQIGQ